MHSMASMLSTLTRPSPPSLVQLGSKGWGLLADCNLPSHTLVAEYVGEVVGTQEKARRMEHYESQGLAHTYMMTLSAGQVGGRRARAAAALVQPGGQPPGRASTGHYCCCCLACCQLCCLLCWQHITAYLCKV